MPPTGPSPAAQALAALDRGVWGLAERIAHHAVEANPADAASWNVRGRVAMLARRPDLATRWFTRAGEADPRFKPAAKNLLDARAATPAPPPPPPAFLIILPWGAGFFSDVDMVLGGALTAEITGRTPVVLWGRGSLFHDEGTANAWTRFFEPLSGATEAEALDRCRDGLFHPRYSTENLPQGPQHKTIGPGSLLAAYHHFPRTEPVCVFDFHTGIANLLDWLPDGHRLCGASVADAYRDMAARYLRPAPAIAAAADELEQRRLRDRPGPVLAVHARGSDKFAEDPDIAKAHAEYPARIDAFLATEADARVFLITDSTHLLAEFSGRYGDRLITTDAARTAGRQGIHYLAAPSRESLGRDVLLDALLAARCDAFLGYGMSNVSCFVRALKDWPPGACTVIGRAMVEIRK